MTILVKDFPSKIRDFNLKSMSNGKCFHIFKEAIGDFYEKFFHLWVSLKHRSTRKKIVRHAMDYHAFTAIELIKR